MEAFINMIMDLIERIKNLVFEIIDKANANEDKE